jgi:hypothetical protein
MKQRCLNPANKDFKYYGGRGISVCERWLAFENFFADMGSAPDQLTLDRYPNADGNYEPDNCRWATMKEQNRNKRSHVMVTHAGRTQCLSAWAEELDVNEPMLRVYLKKKIPLEEAVEALRNRVARNRIEGCNGQKKINSTGYPGVKRSLNKWIARIVIDGERKHLGTFETAELASAAYQTFKNSMNELAGV